MKIDKKISIVTACFNEEKKIKKTINSWLKYFKQDLIFKKFEIIITDDGSHDETFNILKKLKKKIQKLKYINSKRIWEHLLLLIIQLKKVNMSLY